MKVVIKHPNQSAYIHNIEPFNRNQSWKAIGNMIGQDAYIDLAVKANHMFGTDDLVVYCHDEGLILNLPLNFFRPTDQSPIVGPVVAVKTDSDGEEQDMTDAEAEATVIMLNTWSKYSVHLEKELN